MSESTIKGVANRAQKQAHIHGRLLQYIANFNDAPRSGRPKAFTKDQGDAPANHILLSKETGSKTAAEHIAHLEFKISVSLFENLMYDRHINLHKGEWKSH